MSNLNDLMIDIDASIMNLEMICANYLLQLFALLNTPSISLTIDIPFETDSGIVVEEVQEISYDDLEGGFKVLFTGKEEEVLWETLDTSSQIRIINILHMLNLTEPISEAPISPEEAH